MTKDTLKKLILTGAMALLAVLFTIAVENVDTTIIWGEEIGFSRVNLAVHQFLQTSETYDFLSDITFLFSIVLALGMVTFGAVQLLKRKSIKKVDKEILIAGIVFALTAVVYLFFEFVVINHRPILVEGELEASYPSSHTLFLLVINLVAIGFIKSKITNKRIMIPAVVGVGLITLLGVVFRVLSGMHWLTDIVGSILIAFTLVMLYYSCTEIKCEKKEKSQEENKSESAN